MEEFEEVFAPSMPLGISVPTILALAVLAVYAAWRLRSAPATLVIAAVWLRYATSIFHEFTFGRSPVGISWNALVSTAVVVAGMFILKPRFLTLKMLIPIYAVVLVGLVSAIVNNMYGNLIVTTTKTGYLLVVTLCTFEALVRHGEKFFTWLMVAFVPPFVLQMVSFLIGQTKSGEIDGSISYVGGYNHEGSISIVLATALMLACIVRSMPLWVRTTAIVGGVIGISLADYRTTIVAFVPFMLVCFLVGPLRQLSAPYRAMTLVLFGGVALVTVAVSADGIGERYGELAEIPDIPGYIVRDPNQFNREQQQLLSGRAYLWSKYIDAWRKGPPHYELIGAGPEARIVTKDRYPHNTLVSALYEYGLIGLLAYTVLLISPMVYALRAAPGDRARIIAAHVSFFLLNMATMPLWQIEGNILYGLLCGYTFYAVTAGRWPAATLLGHRDTMRPAWQSG